MTLSEYRKGNLNNISTILLRKWNNINPEQGASLSKCFDVLSQEELTLEDSVKVEKICSQFGVLLPF